MSCLPTTYAAVDRSSYPPGREDGYRGTRRTASALSVELNFSRDAANRWHIDVGGHRAYDRCAMIWPRKRRRCRADRCTLRNWTGLLRHLANGVFKGFNLGQSAC